MVWVAVLLVQAAAAQDQIQSGEKIYMDAEKGCASCHALKGKGTAVGPDLSTLARLSTQAMAMAIKSTAAQYVQQIKLKSGETLTAMPGAKEGNTVTLWDLSKKPPEAKKVDKGDIVSSNNTDAWKHPPVANKLSDQEIADVMAYIRATVTGQKKAIPASEAK